MLRLKQIVFAINLVFSFAAKAAATVSLQDECLVTLTNAPQFKANTTVSLERPSGERLRGTVISNQSGKLKIKLKDLINCPILLNETFEVLTDDSLKKPPPAPKKASILGHKSGAIYVGYLQIRNGKSEGEAPPFQSNIWYDAFDVRATGRVYQKFNSEFNIPITIGVGWFYASKPFNGNRITTTTDDKGGKISYTQSLSSTYLHLGSGISHPLSETSAISAELSFDWGLSGLLMRTGDRQQSSDISRFIRTSINARATYAVLKNLDVVVHLHTGAGFFALASQVDIAGVGPFYLLETGFGIGSEMRL